MRILNVELRTLGAGHRFPAADVLVREEPDEEEEDDDSNEEDEDDNDDGYSE